MSSDRLFTPRFFVMCGFTFTVFLSAFQLLPTAPFHILDMGGSHVRVGSVSGSSRIRPRSPAVDGHAGRPLRPAAGPHRVEPGARRRSRLATRLIPGCPHDLRAVVVVHGIFWSGLLSASASYMTNMLPERRRTEGIGYWGLSTVAAMAVAPPLGLWI